MVHLRSFHVPCFPLFSQLNNHPSRDINAHQATVMDVLKCVSCMHLPNGSYVTFGSSWTWELSPRGENGASDAIYEDYGSKAIHISNPCTDSDKLGISGRA